MSVKGQKPQRNSGGNTIGFKDILVILICLSGVLYSLYLFRLDLFRTIVSLNKEPLGVVIIKNNIVQRRIGDRVLWDRLVNGSSVYSGDMIRVAEFSNATLYIDDKYIELIENTLIHIYRGLEKEDIFQIDLLLGEMGLTAGPGGGNVKLNINGREVEAGPGTRLNAAAAGDGIRVQVNEGQARFLTEGQLREMAAGTMVALNAEGMERIDKGAVVTHPRLNSRFLKSSPEPLGVNFTWNRINLQPRDTLRLEIAQDRNFSHSLQPIEGLFSSTEAALDSGLWYWRMLCEDLVLDTGQFIITEALGPRLLSPARDGRFRYELEQPKLYFQWSEVPEAAYYILEAGDNPDFLAPRINRQVEVNFYADSSLGPGTWYWRVLPVFSPVYEGSAAYSSAASFRIFQGDEPEPQPELIAMVPETPEPEPELLALVPELPEPEPEAEPVPEPPRIRHITLEAPAQGASLPGLTALRQQTVFRWSSEEEVGKSRFILSRNSNLSRGQPAVVILNPGRIIRLDRLEEGTWYWTVEAETPAGIDISAVTPRQLRVQPIVLLPAPENRRPAGGYSIGLDELRTQRNIVFSWSAVPGANAYIFTLLQQTDNGRRQIIRIGPENRTRWTLENLSLLDQGTFYWQVEAVYSGRNNVIEQQGRIGENSFVVDIPIPSQVQAEEPGILYGN
jgi:hypothetical protein